MLAIVDGDAITEALDHVREAIRIAQRDGAAWRLLDRLKSVESLLVSAPDLIGALRDLADPGLPR